MARYSYAFYAEPGYAGALSCIENKKLKIPSALQLPSILREKAFFTPGAYYAAINYPYASVRIAARSAFGDIEK